MTDEEGAILGKCCLVSLKLMLLSWSKFVVGAKYFVYCIFE